MIHYQPPLLHQLLIASSPLVGSACHVAASNLTRLSTLYHLLTLMDMTTSPAWSPSLTATATAATTYPAAASTSVAAAAAATGFLSATHQDENNNNTKFDKTTTTTTTLCSQLVVIQHHQQQLNEVLNKLDFRGFGVVDCLFDSLMNLREMAPAACRSLAQYYDELMATTTTNTTNNSKKMENCASDGEIRFEQLLRRCVYKLVNDFRAVIFCMPRITSKLQALEFLKLIVFMCKFPNRVNCKTNDETNFEMFCLNFLRRFILDGELLNLRSTTTHRGSGGKQIILILIIIIYIFF